MSSRTLGASGVVVPPIGLGTWASFDTERSMRWLTDEALDAGVNLFDSSPMYGRAEDRLGEALRDRRAEAIVATKVSAVDAGQGRAQIDKALGLFGSVDLLQIHNIVGWRIHLPELVKLRQSGAIRAIGASQGLLVSDDEFEEVMHSGQLDAIQVRYNPKRTQAADRLLPLAEKLGISVLVMQPLRWGALLASPTTEELAALGVLNWGAAVLRWILSDHRVTTVLTATTVPGRIGDNAQVGRLSPFTSDQRALFDLIMARGPGSSSAQVATSPTDLLDQLDRFLSARLGAGHCDSCLARAFTTTVAVLASVRDKLPPDRFADEAGACLMCGEEGRIVRSRTIMR